MGYEVENTADYRRGYWQGVRDTEDAWKRQLARMEESIKAMQREIVVTTFRELTP